MSTGADIVRVWRSVARLRISIAAVVVCLSVGWIVVLCVGVAPASAAEGCGNERVREEQNSQFLPECRAYEMVSPLGSIPDYYAQASSEVPFPGLTLSSVAGDAVAYDSLYSISGAGSSGEALLARRGMDGWSTEEMVPPQSASGNPVPFSDCQPKVFFSPDLSQSILSDGFVGDRQDKSPFAPCEVDQPALVEGEPSGGFTNIFLRGEAPGSYQLVNVTPAGVAPQNAIFQDASSDFSHIVFGEEAELTPEASNALSLYEWDLYEWMEGALRLVTVLPDGTPTSGDMVNGQGRQITEALQVDGAIAGTATFTHGMSASGERVFFTTGGGLYLRMNAAQAQSAIAPGVTGTKVNGEQCMEPERACTIQLDASETGGAGGGGAFLYASADGSRAFFVDENALTAGSTSVSGKPDLYEYDLERPVGERLRDLTVDEQEPADVLGFSAASENGDYLYFVAEGALAGGQKGKPNLYVDHEGAIAFIATLSPNLRNQYDWSEGGESMTYLGSEASPSGLFMAFNSTERLTGYDNAPREAGDCEEEACEELYLYDASDNQLSCVSCEGGAPIGATGINPVEVFYSPTEPRVQRRQVLNDGSVYFDSPDPLVTTDTNGAQDVYEYNGGSLYLISSGTSSAPAVFDEASPSGEDVFFVTGQSLVAADTDESASLYDARVGGGFPAQSARVESPVCGGVEACRSPLGEPPVEQFPASVGAAGPGNLQTAGSPPPGGGEKVVRELTRAQQLEKALAACAKKPKRKRASCRAAAQRKYGARQEGKVKSKHTAKKGEK